MAVVRVVLTNGHIAFLGADGERAFAALSVAQNADILHGHIAAVYHVGGDLTAVFHGDILKSDIALVDIKVNAAAAAHVGVMEIDIGLDQRFCVGNAVVGAVGIGSADDLDVGGVAAEGLENDGVVFLEDIAVVGGNDLQVVGDHIGTNNIVLIVEAGVLAAEDNRDVLTGEGIRHFHQRVDFFQLLHRFAGGGLEHAGSAVGGVPCSVGQKDHGGGLRACGAVLAFQNVQDHITGCVGDRADIGAVEEGLHRIVGIEEAHCLDPIVVHGLNVTQLQLHKAAAAVGEVVAVEVTADGRAAIFCQHIHLADTLRRHVNAGGNLMEIELRPIGHVNGAAVDFRVGFRSAHTASLIIDAKQSIGRVRANHLAVLIQIQHGSLGQAADMTIAEDDSGVPVYDAVAVAVPGDLKADIAAFAVRHVGNVHAVSARGGDGHGSLGVIVVGCELAMLPQNRRDRVAVSRQILKVLIVAEDGAVGAHIEILSALRRLNLTRGGVKRRAALVIDQTSVFIHNCLEGLFVLVLVLTLALGQGLVGLPDLLVGRLELGKNLLVLLVLFIALERFQLIVAGIQILEIEHGVDGLVVFVRGLRHLGAVHQGSLRQIVGDIAILVPAVVDVDIVEIAVGREGNRPVFHVEDTCLIVHFVHEQQTAVDLLVAALEVFAGHKSFAAFDRLEYLEPDGVGISALRHGEVLVLQFLIAGFVPHVAIKVCNLCHLIRANLIVIDGAEGVGTILDGHSCNIAAAISRDGNVAAPITQITPGEADVHVFSLLAGVRTYTAGAGSTCNHTRVYFGFGDRGDADRIHAVRIRSRKVYSNQNIGLYMRNGVCADIDRCHPVRGYHSPDSLCHGLRDGTGCSIQYTQAQFLNDCTGRGSGFLRALGLIVCARCVRLTKLGIGKLIEVALLEGIAVVGGVHAQLYHMIEGSVGAQLFQQVQIAADGNGIDFGDAPVLLLRKDVREIDVGAVGQGPRQTVATGHVDRTAHLTNVHGDLVAGEINDLGNLIPIHVGDLADLPAGKGEAHITEIIGDAVGFLLRALELQLTVFTAYPEDQLVGQHVEAFATAGIGIEQVVGKVEVGVIVLMLDGTVGGEHIVRLHIVTVFIHILDDGIRGNFAHIHQIVAVSGQVHIHLGVDLELRHHLSGGFDGQFHITGFRGDLAQRQLGIVDRMGLTLRVLAVHENMLDLRPDVSDSLHGDKGIPLALGEEAVIIGLRDLRDIGAEGVLLGADAACAGDGELVGPQLGACRGAEAAAVHPDIHSALRHILVQKRSAVDGLEDHIATLFGDNAKAGQLMSVLGAEEVYVPVLHAVNQSLGNDEADVQIGSGLLAVHQGHLVDVQGSIGAVGDDHIGQEAAVVNGDRFVGIFRFHIVIVGRGKKLHKIGCRPFLAHIGLRGQGAPVIVVKTVEMDFAVCNSAHSGCIGKALIIQTGEVQISVFVNIHEAARCRAAKVEFAVEDDFAGHFQRCAGNGFLTAVVSLTEGKDLHQPLGSGVGFGLGAAFHAVCAVYIGRAGHDLHILTCHIRQRGDVDLRHDGVGTILTVDPDVGLGSGLAGGARDVGGSDGIVVHVGGLGLDIERVDTAKEHIVQADDLLVVHGIDIRPGCRGGACGNRGGACVGVELLDNVGNHLGALRVYIGLLHAVVVFAQGDVGGDLGGHIRFTPVAARKAGHMPVGVRGGAGGVGGLHFQRAEDSGDIRALRDADCGGAGLNHSGLGARARHDDTAAAHIQVGIHVRLRLVAAEDVQIPIAGCQPGVLTDADVLFAVPGQADACLAAFAKAHIGGVDDSVEIHIGVGLHSGIVSGFRVRVIANGHRAALGYRHFDLVGVAAHSADAGAVHPGVGFHLVTSLNQQIVAREDLAVQGNVGGLVIHPVVELVTANLCQTDIGCLVGPGVHLGIGFRVDGHVAGCGDDRAGPHVRGGGVAAYGSVRANDLLVYAADAGGGNLRLGDQLVYIGAGRMIAGVGFDTDAARLDIGVSANRRACGHVFNVGMGQDHIHRRHIGCGFACLRAGGDRQAVGLCQHLHRVVGMDVHIAPDGGRVAHACVGIRPLVAARNETGIGTAVASQLRGGGRFVHLGNDLYVAVGADSTTALQIGVLAHGQIGLRVVQTNVETAHFHFFAVHIRSGGAFAAVHQNVQIAGVHIAAALDTAGGVGIGGGDGLVGGGLGSAQGEAAVRLGGNGIGLGGIREPDADILDINIRSGAVEIGREGAACVGGHHHNAHVGAIGGEAAAVVVSKGIALGLGQDAQIAADIAFASEVGAGNVGLVGGGHVGVRRVALDVGAAEGRVGCLQLGFSALILPVIEIRGNADVVRCLYAAAGDIGVLGGGNGSVHIADQQLDAGNTDLGRANGRKGSCCSVSSHLNAIAAVGDLTGCGNLAVGDVGAVGDARVRVRQIHLTAGKAHADIGLLGGGLGLGGKAASDAQGSRSDFASADRRLEGAVGIRVHADRADVHQTQRGACRLGVGLGIALGVAQEGNRAADLDIRAGGGGFAGSSHPCRHRIDLGAVLRGFDGLVGSAAENGNRAFIRTIVEQARYAQAHAALLLRVVELGLLRAADNGFQNVDRRVVDGNAALGFHFRLRGGSAVRQDADRANIDR